MLSRSLAVGVVLLLVPGAIAPANPNPNIAPNSSFENDVNGDGVPDKWHYDASASDPACSVVWSTAAYVGNRSYALESDSYSSCHAYSDTFSAVAGAEYAASAWTNADAYGSGIPIIRLEFFDQLGSPLPFDPCTGTFPYGGGWQQARYVCVAPPLTVSVRVTLEGSFLNQAGSFAQFDAVIVRAV